MKRTQNRIGYERVSKKNTHTNTDTFTNICVRWISTQFPSTKFTYEKLVNLRLWWKSLTQSDTRRDWTWNHMVEEHASLPHIHGYASTSGFKIPKLLSVILIYLLMYPKTFIIHYSLFIFQYIYEYRCVLDWKILVIYNVNQIHTSV